MRKFLPLLLLVLLPGCAKQVVTKTTTVYRGGVQTVKTPPPPAPTGVISQPDCVNLKTGTAMRVVLDKFGWPHTQDVSDLDFSGATLYYPFSENDKSLCQINFKAGGSKDPDKLKVQSKALILK